MKQDITCIKVNNKQPHHPILSITTKNKQIPFALEWFSFWIKNKKCPLGVFDPTLFCEIFKAYLIMHIIRFHIMN